MIRLGNVGLVLALVLYLSSTSTTAFAAPDASLDAAKVAYDQAEKDYALAHFQEALDGYELAFKQKPLPAFLFNIGQCHRNLGNWDRATFFYQGYLAREPKAKNRGAVVALIELMNQKTAEAAKAAATATPVPATTAAATTTTTPIATTTSSTPAAPIPATTPITVATTVATITTPPRETTERVETPKPSNSEVAPSVLSFATDPNAPPEKSRPKPVYKRWWPWTILGVAVLGGAAGLTAAALDPSVSTDQLRGSLGTTVDVSH